MTKLTLTTAIALLAGTALASAQGGMQPSGNDTQRAAPAPATQQHAPAEKMVPHARTPGNAETTGQAAGSAEMKGGTEHGGKADMKANQNAETKGGMNKDHATSAEKSGGKATETNKSAADENKGVTERNGKSSVQTETRTQGQTTGQGAAGSRGATNLSTEQRTKIRTVFKEKVHVQPVTHVNFSINVGARVPRTVHYHPLPIEVVEVYPAWRGYNFILVNDEIVIIDPSTFEIVAILT
ncbi:MAG: hypothetical protein OJF62_000054 [Pseudolabrys sp.]|jgi:hypothetical protein|nr:hypothetical protein [Pseudolabrys sp.]